MSPGLLDVPLATLPKSCMKLRSQLAGLVGCGVSSSVRCSGTVMWGFGSRARTWFASLPM